MMSCLLCDFSPLFLDLNHYFFLFFREREELSAVCVFSLSDISKVLDGPFKELKKTCENWINPEPVPTPRPGQVLHHVLPLQLYSLYWTQLVSCCYITILTRNFSPPPLHHALVFEHCVKG